VRFESCVGHVADENHDSLHDCEHCDEEQELKEGRRGEQIKT
jgi:hypothetical protein